MSSLGHTARPALPARIYAPALASWFEARPAMLLGLAILAAASLGQLTAFAKLQAVWTTGAFFDTDDAMRMVQVRDLAAGQGWFDMTQYRLGPPAGVFMHWSRVVDVPLILLVKSFSLFADPVTAERLARLAFPFLLTLTFFALAVRLSELLLGHTARWPALAAAFLYGPATGQFEPGRIDHHAPQIVLLMLAVTALAHALIEARPRWAMLAGAAIALSMAISIENIPFFVPLLAALILLWVFDGARVVAVLGAFAVGLAVALPAVYAATIAPSRYLLVVGDALSLAQACAMLAFAAFAASLVVLSPRLPDTWPARATVATMGGGFAVLLLAIGFPELTASPFARLDPLVKTFWLDGVQEALPLPRKFAQDPLVAIALVAPALIGIFGALHAACATEGAKRQAWFLLAIAALGGFAASMMMVRTLSAVLALGLLGALAITLHVQAQGIVRSAWLRGPLATCVLLLATSSMGWTATCVRVRTLTEATTAVPLIARTNPADRVGAIDPARPADASRCTEPHAFASLAKLPPGVVLAEPDLGAYVLAHTPHTVVAGAYHRNDEGMRRTIEALTARPQHAREAVAATGATYLVQCRGATDPLYLAAAANGLAVELSTGHPPDWLRHLAAYNETLDVYDVSAANMNGK